MQAVMFLGRDAHVLTFRLLSHSLEHDLMVLYSLPPLSFVYVLLLFLY